MAKHHHNDTNGDAVVLYDAEDVVQLAVEKLEDCHHIVLWGYAFVHSTIQVSTHDVDGSVLPNSILLFMMKLEQLEKHSQYLQGLIEQPEYGTARNRQQLIDTVCSKSCLFGFLFLSFAIL